MHASCSVGFRYLIQSMLKKGGVLLQAVGCYFALVEDAIYSSLCNAHRMDAHPYSVPLLQAT